MNKVDGTLKNIYGKISKNFKVAFAAAIVVGLIAHIYMFTNKIPNYDDVRTLDGFGTTFTSGRWFLWIIGAVAWHLDFVFSLPWINGLLTVFFIALSAGVLVDILGIKSNTASALTGASMVVFPSWVGSIFFMFIVPYFALAVFMTVMSVYFVLNYRRGWILSVILVSCSMGIYQAYLPFLATLYVVILILKVFDGDKTLKVLKSAIWYFVNILMGVAAYFVITKLSLWITGQELTKTKGIDEMGQFDFGRIPEILKLIIRNIYNVIIGNDLEISNNYILKLMYLVLTVCVIYYMVRFAAAKLKAKDWISLIFFIVLMDVFEVAVNSIFIMCSDGIYSLMYFSYVFLMILPVCFIEHYSGTKIIRCERYVEYSAAIVLALGIASYCHFANAQYLSLELSYEQAISYCTTLVTQIKSAEGYSDEMPVVFVGHEITDKTLYENDVVDRIMFSGREETLVEAYSREYLLRYYCGFNPEYVSSENIDKEIIDEMALYPKDGSIKVADGMVIVRFE